MVGTDNSYVSGYGDGGNIVRARPDGSKLEEVATGFWNPVDLKFDEKGRLLTVDNDPDSRGPNRLVHVVPGGDYGYKSLYGGSGIHPYLAWNGELPGTLPYAVGLGEAPSGLLDASQAALPQDYQGQVLASIWEESRVVRVNLAPKGVSVTGSTQVIVEGDHEFRPVAFATDSKGTVYFTDWVLRDYPNHGRGRIWKLAARPDVKVTKPHQPYASPLQNNVGEPLRKIYAATSPADGKQLMKALQSEDPFLRHAATHVLTRPAYQQQVLEATASPDPDVRLGAMIALHRSGQQDVEPIVKRLLSDPDVRVRQRALLWVGQEGMTALRPDINRALAINPVSPDLFETYLETVKHLSSAFIQSYRNKTEPYAKSIKRPLPDQFIQNFISDKSRPPELRAMAIRHLEKPAEQVRLLTSLLAAGNDAQLRLEAVRALASVPNEEGAERLLQLALTPSNPTTIRAEALLSLTRQPVDLSAKVVPLLQDAEPDVQIEAARYLRARLSSEEFRQALQSNFKASIEVKEEPLQQQFALALSPSNAKAPLPARPSSLQEWEHELAAGGNPQRGRRVFYSQQSACASCHAVQGRGGDLGPDLTNVGLSKSRSQLVSSILRPSEEVTPEYQGWFIKLKDGKVHQGRQIDIGGNSIKLYTHTAGFVSFPKKEILDYGMIKSSLMPEGLEARLTVSDLRDLISFLEAKK
ncbi:HEAT repeat domain-containing protein [Pontibacter pamirensis]|uniref:HEAT repeat domain-containing protein n=1 Tax=Pontibacter pamirensis TaxID=2562824 RepID=UPI001F245043|nr:HEAT repeat domain-containing protein [Pontibacter pamirensis]